MDSARSLKFKSRAMRLKTQSCICKFSVRVGIALKPSSVFGGRGVKGKTRFGLFN